MSNTMSMSIIGHVSEAVLSNRTLEAALANIAIWETTRLLADPAEPNSRFRLLFALVLDEWCRTKGPITR